PWANVVTSGWSAHPRSPPPPTGGPASKPPPSPTPASSSPPNPWRSAPASISQMLPATRSRSAAASNDWWCARLRARGIFRFWSVEDEKRSRPRQRSKRPIGREWRHRRRARAAAPPHPPGAHAAEAPPRAGAFYSSIFSRGLPAVEQLILVVDAAAEAANQVSYGQGHRGSGVRALLYGCTQEVVGLAGGFADGVGRGRRRVLRLSVD